MELTNSTVDSTIDMNNLNTVMEATESFINMSDFNLDNVDSLVDTTLSVVSSFIDMSNLDMQVINNEVDAVIAEALNKPIGPRTILVIGSDKEGNNVELFQGQSSLTKVELKAQFGDNIFVYYQQLYTTVTGNQTYDEAVADEANFKKYCYSREEFVEAFTNSFSDIKYAYITYSHKDLRKQQRANTVTTFKKDNLVKVSKIKKDNKVDEVQANFALYLFTSMSQLSNGVFPISGLSDLQISTAKQVLELEDYYINEHVLAEDEDESIKQQTEAILFIVGTPAANNSYIKMSNLRWIEQSDSGETVKGLIKNNINPQTGIQVCMLRINVWDKRQSDVFIHCNYTSPAIAK